MRRIISIGLLVLHLGLYTEMDEIVRLPILIEHFLEHRSQVADMSFLQFLVMHYKTDVAHDSTDMELPFKDCTKSMATASFALPEQKVPMPLEPVARRPEFSSKYISFIPASALDEIFQPPRG